MICKKYLLSKMAHILAKSRYIENVHYFTKTLFIRLLYCPIGNYNNKVLLRIWHENIHPLIQTATRVHLSKDRYYSEYKIEPLCSNTSWNTLLNDLYARLWCASYKSLGHTYRATLCTTTLLDSFITSWNKSLPATI